MTALIYSICKSLAFTLFDTSNMKRFSFTKQQL